MDIDLPPINVPQLLRQHGLRPAKSLGQNFLIDPFALKRVCAAAGIASGDTILEIGPGLGSLTRYLAARAHRVIAVELDDKFIQPLHEVLSPYDNVKVVQGDILQVDLAELLDQPGYLVVANIPYYITSALIRHLLEAPHAPARLVLTVQKEVAQRICAQPGKMSLLALSVQVYGAPLTVADIPAGAFYPPPKVDSAIVRVDLHPQPLIPPAELEVFFRLAKAGFSQKRKTLRNALAGGLAWSKDNVTDLLLRAGVDPMRRAETLGLKEWEALVSQYTRGD